MLICSDCGAEAIASLVFIGKPHLGCRKNGIWHLKGKVGTITEIAGKL